MYKRNSKILAALLTIVLVFSIFPSLRVNAAAIGGDCGANGNNLTWTFDDTTGILTISGTGEMTDWSDWSTYAPWYNQKDSITKVVIEEGVTSVGVRAFRNLSNLESVTLPDSVTVIGDRSFSSCSNLSSINLPNNLTLIDNYAFYGCSSLTSIVFPSTLTTIGENAFESCSGLTEIDIPDSVTTLGDQAFAQCTSLKSATLSNQLTELPGTFYGCSQLTTVTIPDSVTTLNKGTFYDCTSLESITIPNSVQDIGINAFYNCDKLQTTDNSINIDKALYDANKSAFPSFPNSSFDFTEYTVTYDTATSNGSVTGTTTTSVSGESIVLTVSPSSGYVVKEVTYTDINNTPVPITPDASGNYSFTMPSCNTTVSATFIPGGYCGTLAENSGLNVKWTLDSGTLTITGNGGTVEPAAGYAPWYKYRDSIVTVILSDGVTFIGQANFYECDNLKSIDIPNSVTYIAGGAFAFCSSLENVVIPDNVIYIDSSAFAFCTNLESVVIPDGISWIGNQAFMGCTKLKNINIPDGIDKIYGSAFADCTSLESIDIPDSVKTIEEGAFAGCTSLKSISIPDGVTSVGIGAFGYCTNLKDVFMSKTVYDNIVATNGISDVFSGDSNPSIHVSYTVAYSSMGNGTITGTTAESFGTDEIELTIQPDNNFELDKIEWSDGTKSGVLTESNGKYTMPDSEAGAITITATFKPIQKTVTFKNEDGTVLQSGGVDYGTNPTYTGTTPAKAEDDKHTYTFAGWSDGTKTYGPTDTLPAVTDDVTYTATFTETAKPAPVTAAKPGTYYLSSMVEKDGNIVVTIKMSEDDTKTFDLLGTVTSDGVALTEGNQYTAAKGSAIITINKSFLDTLATGNHKLTVTFTDGGSITIDYEVKAPAAAPQAAAQAVQATGEAVSAASIAGVCLILAAAGIAYTVTRKRKEEA